jgi:hypothetical protein
MHLVEAELPYIGIRAGLARRFEAGVEEEERGSEENE